MFWIGGDDLRHWLDIAWERINSLRPPPGVDFSWRSTWPIPLYGLACVAHGRLRALKPRLLPTLTTTSVPEVYGVFALGHVAHLEANRLSQKVAEHSDLDHILAVAGWARLLIDKPVDDFEVWRLNLRRSWASEQTDPHGCLLPPRPPDGERTPFRDIGIVTLFVSEELERNSIFRPSLPSDKKLIRDFTWLMFSSMIARWRSASKGVLRSNAILQCYFACLLAFKWLGGRYCHYASIFGLEQASLIAVQIGLSHIDWKIKHGEWVAQDPGTTFAKLELRVW